MASPANQERLRQGIEAARRKDRVTARRLLQQVLIEDRDNETAMMWMASVVDSLTERRQLLERALRVNPNNTRAREALEHMGVSTATFGKAGSGSSNPIGNVSRPSRTSQTNPYFIAAAVVTILLIGIIGAVLLSNQPAPTPTPGSFAALLEPTITSTPDLRPATETPFFGVLVTFQPNENSLPASFTPTETATPTHTPQPTATAFSPVGYRVLFTAFQPDLDQPALYESLGDGTNQNLVGSAGSGFTDIAISPDGSQIAFVRVTGAQTGGEGEPQGEAVPQLFIAPVTTPNNARQVTNFSGSRLSHPSWSPAGTRLVFSSNEDGDDELWTINADSSDLFQLTFNDAVDITPEFSPDGTQIVFASDMDSPGYSEIYLLDLESSEISRLTDEAGNNYDPTWSPDGSRIVFLSDQGVDADLYVMQADGQNKILLTMDDNGAEDRSPVWSPDNAYIAFASNREGIFQWYLYRWIDRTVIPMIATETDAQSLSFIR